MSPALDHPPTYEAALCALLEQIEDLAQRAAEGFCDPAQDGPNTQTLLRLNEGEVELSTRISGEDKDPRKDAHHIMARRSLEGRVSKAARSILDLLRAEVPALDMNAHTLVLVSTGPAERIQYKLVIGDLWKSKGLQPVGLLTNHLLEALQRVSNLPAPEGRKFIVGKDIPIMAADPCAAMRLYAAFESPWLFDPAKQQGLTNVPILEYLDGPAAVRSLLEPYTPIS